MRNLYLVLVLTAFSCVPQKKYNQLEEKYYSALSGVVKEKENSSTLLEQAQQKRKNLASEIEKLNSEVKNLESKRNKLSKNNTSLKSDYEQLIAENIEQQRIQDEKNEKLRTELERSEALLQQREKELRDKITRVEVLEQLLNEQREQTKTLKNSLTSSLKAFEGKGITVTEQNGRIYVSMENKLLFASGQWTVEKQGENALLEVAKTLKKQKEISILVEGHTDNVPFTARTEVKDNWDLSVMRATSIVRVLQKQGLKPDQIIAAGRSSYFPIASNATKKGKAKNRRVEIILTPDLAKINQLLNSI